MFETGSALDRFAQAFSSGGGGCRRMCECGKEYYNPDGGWDWEEGELEELESSGAIEVDFTVSTISFEGKEFVEVCDCWHERAKTLMSWMNGHATKIAKYLNGEKQHKKEIYEAAPTVEEG